MKKRITLINTGKQNAVSGFEAASNTPVFNTNINHLGDTKDIDIYGDSGAMFSLEITNKNGYSILKNPIANAVIPINGVYSFTQIYPRVVYNDIYTITITPLHNTELRIGNTHKQYQYINPSVTFTFTSGRASLSGTGSDVVVRNSSQELVSNLRPLVSESNKKTHTVTATEGGILLYVIPTDFSRDYSNNKDVNKTIKSTVINDSVLQIHPNTTDLEIGAVFNLKASFEKTLLNAILEVGITRENELEKSLIATDKFKINNTTSLTVGMIVSGSNVLPNTTLKSIDSEQNITLSKEQSLNDNIILTFKQDSSGSIKSIDNFYQISLNNRVTIPGGTVIKFNSNEENSKVNTSVIGSGTTSITITNNIDVLKFGKENSINTQTISNFLSLTPNAYSQRLETTKATATNSGAITINVLEPDTDSNVSAKTPAVATGSSSGPSHGTLNDDSFAAGVGTCTYTPFKGFTGQDKFHFSVQDAGGATSEITPIYITVK